MLVRPAPEWRAEEFGPGSPSRCDQPAFALVALSLASDTYENMRRTQQGAFTAAEDDDGDGRIAERPLGSAAVKRLGRPGPG